MGVECPHGRVPEIPSLLLFLIFPRHLVPTQHNLIVSAALYDVWRCSRVLMFILLTSLSFLTSVLQFLSLSPYHPRI